MKSPTISRRKEDPHGLGYDALCREGIRLAQAASGDLWTDYNAHDPGVTILEHLCHAIADLGYRLGFDVADLLTEADGGIDFRRQALFLPEQILPCAPVTPIDFAKRLYSDFHEIEEVHVEQVLPGVHRVFVRADDLGTLAPRIHRALENDRPIGEAFESVQALPSRACLLAGEVSLDGTRDAALVFADIHFRCARKLSSDIRFRRYDELLAEGADLVELLTGPLTPQGLLRDEDFREARRNPSLSELQRIVEDVPGVRSVRNLSLRDASGAVVGDSPTERRHLLFPEADRSRLLVAFAPDPGIPMRSFLETARRHVEKLEFGHRALRRDRDVSSQLPAPPVGRHRALGAWRSIQEEFPGVYGIGAHGVPDGAPANVKAWAKQLKAYLYPFEQIMVDFLGNLEAIPERFSTTDWDGTTYRSRPPSDTAIPWSKDVFVGGDVSVSARATLARHDDALERRGRLLDTMLAQYGEGFPDALFRDFDPYHPERAEAWIVEAKTLLLRHLPELSARRADPRMWKLRAGILLGIPHPGRDRILSDRNACRAIVDHDRYVASPDTITIPSDRSLVPLDEDGQEMSASVDLSRLPRLSDRMHRAGCDARRYVALQHGAGMVLAYHDGGPEPAYGIAPFRDLDAARQAANALRRHLVEENRASEGFHLVEHILLHPRVATEPFRGIPADWFTLRVSVVLSGWSARFANPEFRDAAEEILAGTLPAHVLPTFLWLDRAAMREFEIVHARWIRLATKAESVASGGGVALDVQAARLARLLLRHESAMPARMRF